MAHFIFQTETHNASPDVDSFAVLNVMFTCDMALLIGGLCSTYRGVPLFCVWSLLKPGLDLWEKLKDDIM